MSQQFDHLNKRDLTKEACDNFFVGCTEDDQNTKNATALALISIAKSLESIVKMLEAQGDSK